MNLGLILLKGFVAEISAEKISGILKFRKRNGAEHRAILFGLSIRGRFCRVKLLVADPFARPNFFLLFLQFSFDSPVPVQMVPC